MTEPYQIISLPVEDWGLAAIYEPPQRKLYDWRDNPLVVPAPCEDAQQAFTEQCIFEESSEIDDVCRRIARCPSVEALAEYSPAVRNTKVFLKSDEDEDAPYGQYQGGEFSLLYLEEASNRKWYPGTAAHEFRHGWHDENGILIGNLLSIFNRIALVRAYEADSTVMKITTAVEIKECTGDESVIRSITKMKGYNIAARAFMNVMKKNREALWSGEAHRAAYLAYLDNRNKNLLTCYDKKSCEEEEQWLRKGADCSEERKDEHARLRDTLRKIFSMPYKDRATGALVERQAYKSLADIVTPQLLLATMTEEIRKRAESLARGIIQPDKIGSPEIV
jgi:hypothetical protein